MSFLLQPKLPHIKNIDKNLYEITTLFFHSKFTYDITIQNDNELNK